MPWLVSGARLTVFVTADANISSTLWSEVVGAEPEHSSVQRTVATTLDMGPFADGLLRLQTQPMRLDWNYDASQVGARSADPPHFGSFPTAVSPFLELMRQWIRRPSFPPTTRIALGLVLIRPTSTRETGYAELAQYIDGVPTSSDATEFQYQINRPRPSRVLPDLLINRLSRWSVANYVSLTFDPTVQQHLIPPQRLHVRLELDISTAAGRADSIPADRIPNLLEDLLNGAREISENGNHF